MMSTVTMTDEDQLFDLELRVVPLDPSATPGQTTYGPTTAPFGQSGDSRSVPPL